MSLRTFSYGIGGTDIITLTDASGTVVSTTGRLQGRGTHTTTIQLRDDGISYTYAPATPNAVNVFRLLDVVVNEVASTGNLTVCTSTDYIELLNRCPSTFDISGWILCDDTMQPLLYRPILRSNRMDSQYSANCNLDLVSVVQTR